MYTNTTRTHLSKDAKKKLLRLTSSTLVRLTKAFSLDFGCRGSNNTVRIVMTISPKGAKRLDYGWFNSLQND